MAENGYSFKVEDVKNLGAVKQQYQVPLQLQSCHTAIVDGYIIEGHVPVDAVERLLREKPQGIAGIAVPGMPLGSPGMEVSTGEVQAYDVIAFDTAGNLQVYASYGQ